jgi:outer membrane protein assembly factor BamD (BamD/ComL family)
MGQVLIFEKSCFDEAEPMVAQKTRLAVVAGLCLCLFSHVRGATWYLEQDKDWKPISDKGKAAYEQASQFYRHGNYAKAVRYYDKFLEECKPENALYMEVLEREFDIAKAFLAGRKKLVLGIFRMDAYAEGIKIMERISKRAPKAKIGAEALVTVATYYEKRGACNSSNYELGYLEWLGAYDNYDKQIKLSPPVPTGLLGKDALLGMARCKYLSYGGPAYDASDLADRPLNIKPYISAKSCYERFKTQYPADSGKLDVDEKLKEIDEKLAYKDFCTGRYYQKRGDRTSANLYYQMVVHDWPTTKAAEMAREMLNKNLGSPKS